MAMSAKILLKETTKMTLHERFSMYQKNAVVVDNIPGTSRLRPMQQRASAKNQRLAIHMGNRPSVIAALKLKKKSMRQRLGKTGGNFNGQSYQNIKSRLNFGVRPALQNRLGVNFQNRNFPGRFSNRSGAMRGRFNRPGTSPMLKNRLGTNMNPFLMYDGRNNLSRVGTAMVGRLTQKVNIKRGRAFNRGRGFIQQRQQQQNQQFNNQSPRFRGRFQNNNQRQGRGRGRGNKNVAPTSKQDLDNDLDQYMAQTKVQLDAELHRYMSQA